MIIAVACEMQLVQYFGHAALVPERRFPAMLNLGAAGVARQEDDGIDLDISFEVVQYFVHQQY